MQKGDKNIYIKKSIKPNQIKVKPEKLIYIKKFKKIKKLKIKTNNTNKTKHIQLSIKI